MIDADPGGRKDGGWHGRQANVGATGNGLNLPSAEAFGDINTAMMQAAERNGVFMQTALEAWGRETQRFYDEMSAQGAKTFEQLKACKSPLDVLSTEQAWLSARSKAYMDAGTRWAQIFAEATHGKPVPTAPAV